MHAKIIKFKKSLHTSHVKPARDLTTVSNGSTCTLSIKTYDVSLTLLPVILGAVLMN